MVSVHSNSFIFKFVIDLDTLFFCLLFTLKFGVNLRFNINHQCSIINHLFTNAIKEERKINPDFSLHLVDESFSN